jgi:hypothetical protein
MDKLLRCQMALVAVVVALVFGVPAHAATVTGGSCSSRDVQLAIGSATNGDTVVVPAGSCTWTTQVTISGKALTLQGAGIDATNITDGTSGGALVVTATATNFVRVTGFTFIKSANNAGGIVQITGTQAQLAFRFDHNRILQATSGARGIYPVSVYGVIDHNTFDVTAVTGSVQSISIDGSPVNSDGGYTPWTLPLTFGTSNGVYIEDNTFNYGSQAEDALDAYAGARFVFRYNIVNNISIGFHGTDSGGIRSVFSAEVYANTFTNNGANVIRPITTRGGTFLVYDNVYGGSKGYFDFYMLYYRATFNSAYHTTWGNCDGTNYDIGSADFSSNDSRKTVAAGAGVRFLASNPDTVSAVGTRYFDGSGSGGYPCRDQQGRTQNQALAPLYQWNNGSTYLGAAPVWYAYDGGAPIGLPISTWLLANRDFYDYTTSFNGTVGVGRGTLAARPAACTPLTAYFATDTNTLYQCASANTWTPYYTPYTYPHPLLSGTPRPAPTNLRVR